jgi:hypothetical protein
MATPKLRDHAGNEVPLSPTPAPTDTAVLKARTATYDRTPGPDILHEEVRTPELGYEPKYTEAVTPKRKPGRPKKS